MNSLVNGLAVEFPACRIDEIEAVSPTLFLQKQGNAIAEAKRPPCSHNDNAPGFKKTLKAVDRHKIHIPHPTGLRKIGK